MKDKPGRNPDFSSRSLEDLYDLADNILKSLPTRRSLESTLVTMANTDLVEAWKVSAILLHEDELSHEKFPKAQRNIFNIFCRLLPAVARVRPEEAVNELNDLFGRALSEGMYLERAKFYKPGEIGYDSVVLGNSTLTAENVDTLYKVVQGIDWPDSVNLGNINSWYDAMEKKRK